MKRSLVRLNRPLYRPLLLTLGAGGLLALAGATLSGDPLKQLFAGNYTNIGFLLEGLYPPNTSAGYLQSTLRPLYETLQIALLGTVMAVLLALPLAYGAVRDRGEEVTLRARGAGLWSLRLLRITLCRGAANLLRAIPDLLWALIFVVMVGLGPLAGILALAVHSAGILGKLYADIVEATDPLYTEGLRSTGASRLAVLLFAGIPSNASTLLSYSLFRFECNLRAATILGFVGAGGVGTQVIVSLKLFQYAELATLIAEILILVTGAELFGAWLRRRVLDYQGNRRPGTLQAYRVPAV